MAHSIEARVPFLDYRLIEFMMALPDRMKIRNGQMKWLLRQALHDVLPIEVSQRRSKLGFATPEQCWLHQQWGRVGDILRESELARRGWVKSQTLDRLFTRWDHVARGGKYPVWRWLNLEIWARSYLP
jgi:asparagine synthase (glutamine-hydrolysing)